MQSSHFLDLYSSLKADITRYSGGKLYECSGNGLSTAVY